MAQTKHASIVSDSYLADFHSLYLTLYNLELMLISEYHSPKSIISLDLPERKLPLSNGGLNGVNKTRGTDNLNITLLQLFLLVISTHVTNGRKIASIIL